MFDLKAIVKDERKLKALTGLSIKGFEKLLKEFIVFLPIKTPRGSKPVLKSPREKLFFILFYLKCYPTMDVAASIYNVNRSQISRWVNQLNPVLGKTLGKEQVLPLREVRNGFELYKLFSGIKEVFLDGTERSINRPKRNQKKYYSAKKKGHKVKNLILADKKKRVLVLTKTVAGKNHDFGIYKTGLIILFWLKVWLDLGFLGIKKEFPSNQYFMPHKKPKGGKLTEEQKAENTEISRVRVKIEHTISGIKRYNCVSQKYRNKGIKKADDFMFLATGLWNFHLKYG